MDATPHIAALISRSEAGDPQATDQLFAALYEELHRLAQREVRRLGEYSPLGVTTLLHEAWLAFGTKEGPEFPDESRFLAYAARAMRGVVIDRVRAQQATKRGGGVRITTLEAHHAQEVTEGEELLALHHALESLEALDPLLARVVDLHFFCGFTFHEIGAVLGVTERTAQRHWAKARLFLHKTLRDNGSATGG